MFAPSPGKQRPDPSGETAKSREESAVKSVFKHVLAPVVAVALVAVPLLAAVGQTLKPVAVVAIASVKENLADVSYVTRAAGMPDYGDTARFLVSAMASGIDKERPIGMYFLPKEREFHAVAFVPLDKDGLATILKVHKDQLGDPKEVGDGIVELGRARTVFIKEQGGWAFVAEQKEFLTGLPLDPAVVLGDLPKKYNVAGKLLVQNIPAELRRTGIDEIKLGMERFLDSPAARQGKLNREQARQLTGTYITKIETLLNEAEELFFGLGIEEPAKHIVMDFGVAAKEGTSLARAMALQTDARTNFAGFLLPEAAVTLNVASKASSEDIAQVKAAISAGRGQWSKQIDDSPDIPAEKRDTIKALLGELFDVIEKTVALGRMDFGGALVLLPKSVSFAAGGVVADGAAVERILKSLVDLGKDIPNFPQVKLNAGTIGDMKLNRLTHTVPNGEAREVLGDTLEIIIGVSPNRVIVSGGKDAEGLLRKVIDQSAQQRDKSVRPLELVVSVLPILRFYKSMDNNPLVNSLLASLEQSASDRVTITNEAGSRSSVTRIEIQEGVIKAIGEGAKSAGARFRPPGR
jgi:hypothetical protein